MKDALGSVQSVLVLGAGSDIAQATVRKLVARRARTIVLAVRDPESVATFADELRGARRDRRADDRRSTRTTPTAPRR